MAEVPGDNIKDTRGAVGQELPFNANPLEAEKHRALVRAVKDVLNGLPNIPPPPQSASRIIGNHSLWTDLVLNGINWELPCAVFGIAHIIILYLIGIVVVLYVASDSLNWLAALGAYMLVAGALLFAKGVSETVLDVPSPAAGSAHLMVIMGFTNLVLGLGFFCLPALAAIVFVLAALRLSLP